MKITISDAEDRALNNIRGMPECVHYMVMASDRVNGKIILEGKKSTFDELLSMISEEIGEGLCPKKDISPLLKICEKIDPNSLDWIGE